MSEWFIASDLALGGGDSFKSKNLFTPYKTTVRALFGAKPRN
jgi:hypothetical protein